MKRFLFISYTTTLATSGVGVRVQGVNAHTHKFSFIENLGKISKNLSKNFDIFQQY